MKALIWIAILITSCSTTEYLQKESNPVVTIERAETKTPYGLSPYTFELHVSIPTTPFQGHSHLEGIAFIADHEIWTAAHMYGPFRPETLSDAYKIGPSPLHGLTKCDVAHVRGDWMSFHSRQNGTVWGVMMEAEDLLYTFSVDYQVLQGESGSPVICFEHDKVMGVMSGLYPVERSWEGVRQALFVARFTNGSRVQRIKSPN